MAAGGITRQREPAIGRGVRKTVNERADGIIWTLSLLPLITLAVASLGVVNTVLSSIRARRWDMGVLRRSASRDSGSSA